MKIFHCEIKNEQGFALITAIMMLFAATVMGLMVMNSSEIEILLSGAQQRYENAFNTVDGAASFEAAAIGKVATVHKDTAAERIYQIPDTSNINSVVSPNDSSKTSVFDPGNDMTLPSTPYTVTTTTEADDWPTDNLLQSVAHSDDQFDYQYRTLFKGPGTAANMPKGYGVEGDGVTHYIFEISAKRTTRIDMGGIKLGPKA